MLGNLFAVSVEVPRLAIVDAGDVNPHVVIEIAERATAEWSSDSHEPGAQ
jgi:hypothetical protein